MRQAIIWNILLVLFLWILLNLTNTQLVKDISNTDGIFEPKDIGLKKAHLSCVCGKLEKTKEKYLDIKTSLKFFKETAKDKDILKKISNSPELKEFANCLRCKLTYVNCTEKGKCFKKRIYFSLKRILDRTEITVSNTTVDDMVPPGYIPEVIEIPIGGHKNHSRLPRFVGCEYPFPMETADLSCRINPTHVKCTQRCAFGYTLENGIKKEMQCKFKENRWIPSGFKECVPFVDCSVTMISRGRATCTTASVHTKAECEIECLPYEDKSEVAMALYSCKIDGTWEPPLPYCAIRGSGMVLAPPPQVKLHTEAAD